jgi:hypothetical protein
MIAFSVDDTLGAAFCGFAASCMQVSRKKSTSLYLMVIPCRVYGIFMTQVYTYFSRYPSDKLGYKYLVSGIRLCGVQADDVFWSGYGIDV